MNPRQAIAWYRQTPRLSSPFGCYQLDRQRLRCYATVNNPEVFYAAIDAAIAAWEAGKLSSTLTRAYILRPIAQIRSAMKHDPDANKDWQLLRGEKSVQTAPKEFQA